MLFVATHKHEAKKCPLNSDEGVKMLKEIFSDENMKKHNVKMEEAYVSCPKGEHSIHNGFFIINAESEDSVKKFFEPMEVDVREVVPFGVENL